MSNVLMYITIFTKSARPRRQLGHSGKNMDAVKDKSLKVLGFSHVKWKVHGTEILRLQVYY